MKAVLCKEFGPIENLVIEEVPSLKAGKGKIVVQIKAAGVNFPDILVTEGKYQFKPPLPFSPGAEIAGVVKEVGEGVTHLQEGDRVFVGMLNGGFAEEAVVEAMTAIKIPEGMDFVTASSILLTYGTTYHALVDRAQIREGETLLVMGAAGGVGLAAVDLGKAFGAKVIAAASTDEKLEICKAYGADVLINYSTTDLKEKIKEYTRGQGVNIVYDPVGGAYSESAFRSIAWEGRYLVVGFASGDIPQLPLNLPLLKGAQIVGVFWGSFTARDPKRNFQNTQTLLQLFKEGKIKPFIHATFPLEKTVEALKEVADRKVRGKVVIVNE